MTTDCSVKRIEAPGRFEIFAGGGLATVIIFSVGIFMMVVPIVGWVVGPTLIVLAGLIAIAHLTRLFRNRPAYSGHCPCCGLPAFAGEPGTTGVCYSCKNRFIHRDGALHRLDE